MESLLQKLSLPDLWQQEAVQALRRGDDVLVDAPTGAGKTRVFELLVEDPAWKRSGRQAIFTVPTRALANDKWAEWKELGWNVGIVTGDLSENPSAPVVVATLETQRERFFAGQGPAVLVVDEYQMIADPQRGLHYELILALAPSKTQLLLLSGSVGNPNKVKTWLAGLDRGRPVSLVTATERPVPLDDVHVLGLPHQAPKAIKGFWPRLAIEVLMAEMAPLLIFVPHRKGAEKVARQIADALPAHKPLDLSTHQQQLAGKGLSRMLLKRVAYHHSGLSYEVRAGLVEPLARAGQLHVIVATMGLAAGINFSVRSVFVAESSYHDGPFIHQLQPDELLQMFGRAGRRGKDTVGHVIHGDKNPRLTDARPRELKRVDQLDWPSMIRIMHLEAEKGLSPFETASQFCARLFSSYPVSLGIEAVNKEAPDRSPPPVTPNGSLQTHRRFGFGPNRREILNSEGHWEAYEKQRLGSCRLGEAQSRRRESWIPALQDFSLVAKRTPLGQAKRRGSSEDPTLIKEIVIASRPPNSERWRWTKSVAKRLPPNVRDSISKAQANDWKALLEALSSHTGDAVLSAPFERESQWIVEASFANSRIDGYQDQLGRWLIDPPTRIADLQAETSVITAEEPAPIEPVADSPVHAWRSLGLIDADGTPTRRGRVFSFFYHGEGLAIAAGLESRTYPVEDLLWHLANLRAGHRFRTLEREDDDRLAVVCRQTYGAVNHPGYLRLGLPLQYGEGAAEALRGYFKDSAPRPGPSASAPEDDLGRGDLERAVHEWRSLLRQVGHAPELEWSRWRDFQITARRLLEQISPRVKSFQGIQSALDSAQKQTYSRHKLHPSHLSRS